MQLGHLNNYQNHLSGFLFFNDYSGNKIKIKFFYETNINFNIICTNISFVDGAKQGYKTG